MAYCQKYSGIAIVPWYGSDEWKYVCNLIFGENSDKETRKKALTIISMWKNRINLLCSGVEGTLIILESLFLEDSSTTETNLQLSYASAIMRFINICINVKDRKCTIYELAKKYNIPQWIVRIRHGFAHDQQLPPVYVCKKALLFALDWLRDNYWYKEYDAIKDFVNENDDENQNQKLHDFMKLYCDITLINLKDDINTVFEMGVHVIDRVSSLMGSELENEWQYKKIYQLQVEMISSIDEFANGDSLNDVTVWFVKNYLIEFSDIDEKGRLSSKLLKAWEVMLRHLYKNKYLLLLLMELFDGSSNKSNDKNKRHLYAAWLQEILCAVFREKYSKINVGTNTNLRFSFYDKSYEEDMKVFLNHVLKKPNIYTIQYLHLIMEICNTPKHISTHLIEIVNIFVTGNSPKNKKNHSEFYMELDDSSSEDEDNEKEQPEIINLNSENELVSEWSLVTDKTHFKSLPLGVLPNSITKVNPLLDKYL